MYYHLRSNSILTSVCVSVCLSVCVSVCPRFLLWNIFLKNWFCYKVYSVQNNCTVDGKTKCSAVQCTVRCVCSTAAYTLYTVQLNCRSSRSPWAGLLSRRTQGRTINPKPYNRVARSLRTSEALIHLRKNPQAFPSWVALGGPPWPMVSYDLSLRKTGHNWQRIKLVKSDVNNSISCCTCMPQFIINYQRRHKITKTT